MRLIANIKNRDIRTLKASKNIFSMLILKGGNIIVSLLYVPLLINTLSTYNYGIWLTITSFVVWMDLMDIGLGNGLRNNLSKAIAEGNKNLANIYISTSYFLILLVVLIIALLFSMSNFFLDWSKILNVKTEMAGELKTIVSIVFYFFCLQFVLKLINSILLAFQKPALSALILFLGQLLSFIIVFISVKVFDVSSFIFLATIISIIPVIILIITSFYLFGYPFKKYQPRIKFIKTNKISDILNLGFKFFFLQIITIVIYQTNNLIIAHTLGQSSVTDYNIGYKFMGITSMIFTIIITPFWSASTDAYYRKDFDWIRGSVRKLNFIWFGVIFFGSGLLLFADEIYNLWLGDTVKADNILLLLFFLYFMIYMRYGLFGYILNGIGKIRLQLIITALIAILYIPVTIYFSSYFSLKGVVLSMILFALINATWAQIQYQKLINGTAEGIWIK